MLCGAQGVFPSKCCLTCRVVECGSSEAPQGPQPGRGWGDWVAHRAVSRHQSQKMNSSLRFLDTDFPLQLSTSAQAGQPLRWGDRESGGRVPNTQENSLGVADRHMDKGMSSWSCYMAAQSSSGPPSLSNQTPPGLAWTELAHLFPRWARTFIFCLHTCFTLGPALRTLGPALSQGQAIATPCPA